jgi:nickel-type superoxide dismutase maturation protease
VRARSLAVPLAIALAAGLWRSVRRVEVTGSSMSPTLVPGDRLVVVAPPLGPAPWPAPGEIIAIRDPRLAGRILVKRVAATHRPSGTLVVEGDNRQASTDSRSFGTLPRSSIVGRVVYRYAPSDRKGPLPAPGEYHRS